MNRNWDKCWDGLFTCLKCKSTVMESHGYKHVCGISIEQYGKSQAMDSLQDVIDLNELHERWKKING